MNHSYLIDTGYSHCKWTSVTWLQCVKKNSMCFIIGKLNNSPDKPGRSYVSRIPITDTQYQECLHNMSRFTAAHLLAWILISRPSDPGHPPRLFILPDRQAWSPNRNIAEINASHNLTLIWQTHPICHHGPAGATGSTCRAFRTVWTMVILHYE